MTDQAGAAKPIFIQSIKPLKLLHENCKQFILEQSQNYKDCHKGAGQDADAPQFAFGVAVIGVEFSGTHGLGK
jgi:hypothetical protein